MNVLPTIEWPYLLTLTRLGLALGIGMFVGIERERRGKDSGLRTFTFTALLGAVGALLGEQFAILSLLMIAMLVVFLNVRTLLRNKSTELTTSAALFIIGYAGILCGQGHTLTPAAIAVGTTALLAWKKPLVGFSIGLSDAEFRSALLLAILAFVVYPALPEGAIDPWGVIEPRSAWITVILIAGIGFINYILWKIYGDRGIELTGLLGGLINSSVAVSELATRNRESQNRLQEVAYRGILLATAAMLIRNAALLAIFAPLALLTAAPPLVVMLLICAMFVLLHRRKGFEPAVQSAVSANPAGAEPGNAVDAIPILNFESPFSLKAVLRFGLIFLIIQALGLLAQRLFGSIGVYAISFFGGLFSSSSAVAAAAQLSAQNAISTTVAGNAALLASAVSVLVNLPLVFGSGQHRLSRQLSLALGIVLAGGLLSAIATAMVWPQIMSRLALR